MDWECGELEVGLAANEKFCRWLIPPSELRDKYTDPTLMSSMVWGMMSHTADVADASSLGAFGIIVVSAFDDAELTGANCPGPISDCSADWAYLFLGPTAVAGSSTVSYSIGSCDLDRRSQAKRRLGNDKAILLVAETKSDFFYMHLHVRCLIKE